MLAPLIAATLVSSASPSSPHNAFAVDNSLLRGEWKSQTLGYALFQFCRDGSYFEIQEGSDPKTGKRSYHAEAKGEFLLKVRELTLFQHERTLTSYNADGSIARVQTYGHWSRLVFLLFPKSNDQMQVTDTDGSKRIFDRTARYD